MTINLLQLVSLHNKVHWLNHAQWACYQIRKISGNECAGNVFGATHFNRKPLVSDPGMHHGTCITLTCITLVPWCVSGSLTRGGGERVPGIPGSYATRNFAYLVRGPCRRLYRALAKNTQYGPRYVLCKPDRPVTEFDYPWEATLCISYHLLA